MHPLAYMAAQIAKSNVCELSLPYRLTFAVTDRCQARCAMCNIWRKPAQAELSPAEVGRLFARARNFSWINLTGGELFQRPDIRQVILNTIENSPNLFLLNFPTNGYQTDDITGTVDMILRETRLPRLIVSVSMDGPRELHDQIRGLEGCWTRALSTYRRLREKSGRRFSVYLGYTLQPSNIGAFDDTLEACRRSLGDVSIDDFHVNLVHSSPHYYHNDHSEVLLDYATVAQELERIRSRRRFRRWDPVSYIEKRYQGQISRYLTRGRVPFACQAAAASCFISPSGVVYPCSVFDLPLGSLRDVDMDFPYLWRSAVRTRARDQIRKDLCPGCWTPCEAYQTLLARLFRAGERS